MLRPGRYAACWGDVLTISRSEPIRIVIAEDHAVVRAGLRELLEERCEFLVVGEASDGVEAIALARALEPDVIVMDVSMPNIDGVGATRRIHAALPRVQIIGLSTHERVGDAHAIERAGAVDYFTKGPDTNRLIRRLLAIHGGRTRH